MIYRAATRTASRFRPRVALPLLALPLLLTACDRHPSAVGSLEPPTGSGRAMSGGGPTSAADIPTETPDRKPPSAMPTETDLGMPIYPGSHPMAGPDGAQLALGPDATSKTAFAMLQTPDSFQQVADYYRQHLTTVGPDGKPQPPEEHADTRDGRPLVTLSHLENGNGMKTAEIRQGDGVTLIELMNLPATKSVGEALSHGQVPTANTPAAPTAGSLNKTLSQSGSSQPADQPIGH